MNEKLDDIYLKSLDVLVSTTNKIGEPLSDEQRMVIAGILALYIHEAYRMGAAA